MDAYFKAVGATLVAVILILVLRREGREIGQLLSMLACGLVAMVALNYFRPVADFIQALKRIGNLNGEMVGILLKVVGISVTAEVASLICDDSGNSALGKTLQLLATAVILCLSIPLLNQLVGLIEEISGNL